jgi:DNA (cytosine-5)-methyltransferase 1
MISAKDTFSFIDLFAGIGGFKMALSHHGGNCLGFSEIDKDAIDVYCNNYSFDTSKNLGNITKIENLPKHDLLTAGVPCQSWSIAGKNLGFDDDRGQLWNDTIYLLKQSRPKAFIFENVKGLADPRNKDALNYIMDRISRAGYYADFHLINSHDHGVAQNRVRVYIIGFKNKSYAEKFSPPKPSRFRLNLAEVFGLNLSTNIESSKIDLDLFGEPIKERTMSLSSSNGYNDYFLFNDLRNGKTTIHSWDIVQCSSREKEICLMLLKNRRKSQFGCLDGNPLSLKHFKSIDKSVRKSEIKSLLKKSILKEVGYSYRLSKPNSVKLTENEELILSLAEDDIINIGQLKLQRVLKKEKVSISRNIKSLIEKNCLRCVENRYDFKNGKISSGLFGINRIFLPSSNVFPTLVASDTNDYIATEAISKNGDQSYKEDFLKRIYFQKKFRRISKQEACKIQGFPSDFGLPDSRARWMKLVGNSVSVPVIEKLVRSVLETGVFSGK